jgi:hypothetical protein
VAFLVRVGVGLMMGSAVHAVLGVLAFIGAALVLGGLAWYLKLPVRADPTAPPADSFP